MDGLATGGGSVLSRASSGPPPPARARSPSRLARELGGEIVSCDSLQVYRGLDIGSAKADAARSGARSRITSWTSWIPTQAFSAADYARLAREAPADDRGARGRLPIVVGGTGLYLRALLHGLFAGPVARRRPAAAAGGDRGARTATPVSTGCSPRVDPDGGGAHRAARPRARRARPRGVPRDAAVRSASTTARTRPPLDGLARWLVVGLHPPRDALRAAVEARTRRMLAGGLLDEVRGLARRATRPTCVRCARSATARPWPSCGRR